MEQNEVIVLLSDPNMRIRSRFDTVQINFTISAFQMPNFIMKQKKNFIKEKKQLRLLIKPKNTEKNAMQEINKNKKERCPECTKTNWFEKFYWFISSENYLVLSGRDGQQMNCS